MKYIRFTIALCAVPILGLSGSAWCQDLVSQELVPQELVSADKGSEAVAPDVAAKLRFHARSAYGPWPLLAAAATAGAMQVSDSPREWGQGMEGYGKRLGSTLAYSGLRNALAFGLDAPLHQDPRYARSHETGFWNRMGHVIQGTVLTRKDSGGETFATWRFGSAYGAAFLSNKWYPDRLNTVNLGLSQGSVQIGFDLLTNVGSEFWPDVRHRMRRRRNPPIIRIEQERSNDR
jgi:hypothetical protein